MSTAPTLPPLPPAAAHALVKSRAVPDGEYLPLADGHEDDCARHSPIQMHAYATAHASALAQRVDELQRIADDWAALSQDDGKKDREIDALKQEVEALRRCDVLVHQYIGALLGNRCEVASEATVGMTEYVIDKASAKQRALTNLTAESERLGLYDDKENING